MDLDEKTNLNQLKQCEYHLSFTPKDDWVAVEESDPFWSAKENKFVKVKLFEIDHFIKSIIRTNTRDILHFAFLVILKISQIDKILDRLMDTNIWCSPSTKLVASFDLESNSGGYFQGNLEMKIGRARTQFNVRVSLSNEGKQTGMYL